MHSLIQSLNDKYLDLEVLLTEFDEALANTVEVTVVNDGELGKEYSVMYCIDEDGIVELQKIYDRLEKIIGGKHGVQDNA